MSLPQLSMAYAVSTNRNAESLTTSTDVRKVHEGAIQFETLLIAQVMEKLENAFAPPDNDGVDPARDTLSSIGTHAVAQLLAERHAFGFADMLERAVPVGNTTQSTGVSHK